MKRSPMPVRKTRLSSRKVSKRFSRRRDPKYCAWIRGLPCVVASAGECWGRIECDHVRTRGAGGEDRGNCWPLCTYHHGCRHLWGITSFAAFHLVDPYKRAGALGRRYEELAA